MARKPNATEINRMNAEMKDCVKAHKVISEPELIEHLAAKFPDLKIVMGDLSHYPLTYQRVLNVKFWMYFEDCGRVRDPMQGYRDIMLVEEFDEIIHKLIEAIEKEFAVAS